MRIVSLLPSATEIVYLLGLGDSLVGVTHECNFPAEASTRPQVSYSTIPHDATPIQINDLVEQSAAGGAPTHGLDAETIRDLQPDLVLTQDLCQVCAVPAGHLRSALDEMGVAATTISLDPASLGDVLDDLLRVGEATGTKDRAREVVESLNARLDAVRSAVAGRPRPRTFALEWGDPPFNAGHWVPEMIDIAGGEALLASRGLPSVRVTWDDIAAAGPDVVVFMPCGYDLDGALAQVPQLMEEPGLSSVPNVFAAAADSYYSRPGPRLVDGVEALAWALHPDCGITAAADTIQRVR